MRKLILAGLVLLAGCQGVVGPLQRACYPCQKVDDPCVSIDEQRRRGRNCLALPEESPRVAPPASTAPPIGLPPYNQ
jgi:hypothetical protein